MNTHASYMPPNDAIDLNTCTREEFEAFISSRTTEAKQLVLLRALVDIRDSSAYDVAAKARASMALEDFNK